MADGTGHPESMTSSRSAFTLLEMAVVLAIIGLLMGGVLMGKNLIREIQVRKVLDDAGAYWRAVYQFKDKYGQLPGDFSTAVNVWGSDATYCSTANNGTIGTCNGDGDGVIVGAAGAASTTTEGLQTWKQLQLAGFISGSYTGINGPGSANFDIIAGTNAPIGALKGSTYWFYSWGYQSGGSFFTGDYNNTMVYAGTVASSWPSAAILTGKEAYELDKKADDGLPAFGNIQTLSNSWRSTCATSNTPSAALYPKNSNNSPVCILLFMNTFQAPNHAQ